MNAKQLLRFKKLNDNAILPTQNEDDVGWDLYAIEDVPIIDSNVIKIKTGIALAQSILYHSDKFTLPCVLKIEGRSGLANRGFFPVGGVVDPSYRGEIIILMNVSCVDPIEDGLWFKKGDRVAQLLIYPVLAKCSSSELEVEAAFVDKIQQTRRDEKGWGSTGR